ncbi:MAG TPA: mandelate racemase/muconate lactonizing enzyme family protein [Amycolatopsis sp.]|nr:mandelate racemase/muconate lactonizing enzyme family protein [Amycolatopsis sp.]
MKIVEVIPHIIAERLETSFGMSQFYWNTRSSCVVEIVTDEGVTGWGECFGLPAANRALIESMYAPLLIGRDPTERVSLWEAMYQRGRTHKGIAITALSGVDIALWDLAGKIAGQPVYQLLGGKSDAVQTYASSFYYGGLFDDDIEREAEHLLKQGFTAFKIKVGGRSIEDDAERVRRVRAAVGPDARLAVDANRGYTAAEAIVFGQAISEQNIWWFEEPVPPEDLAGYARVRAALTIPIAGGESEYTRWGFRDLLAGEYVDVVQPDTEACGGIGEMLLIAGMASAFGAAMSPHVWGSAIATATALHVISALPHGTPSMTRERPRMELDTSPNSLRDKLAFLDPGPIMRVPERPGLGIEIDRAGLDHFRV